MRRGGARSRRYGGSEERGDYLITVTFDIEGGNPGGTLYESIGKELGTWGLRDELDPALTGGGRPDEMPDNTYVGLLNGSSAEEIANLPWLLPASKRFWPASGREIADERPDGVPPGEASGVDPAAVQKHHRRDAAPGAMVADGASGQPDGVLGGLRHAPNTPLVLRPTAGRGCP